MAPLTLTAERTLPGIVVENIVVENNWSAGTRLPTVPWRPAASGAIVLDTGCGGGYGAKLPRTAGACRVLAVDYAAVVSHMRHRDDIDSTLDLVLVGMRR